MTDPAPDAARTDARSEVAAKPSAPAGASWVRLVSDLGPAMVFFFAYQWAQKARPDDAIFFATALFLPAAVAGFAFSWWKERQVSPIGVFSFVMIGVFSGLALWLRDDTFIKMRPTLIYGLMGSILLASVAFRRNLLKTLFSGALHMPEAQWRGLAVRAGGLYLCLSAINEAVWRTQSEATWVAYNTWGDAAINLVFWLVNMIWLARHMTDADGKPLLEDKG
jgi:intracellular septation protein